MRARYHIVIVALLLLLAAVVQGRLAHAMSVRGAQPDFVLIVLGCGAALIGGGEASFLGLWAGLLTASLIGADYGSYLTSRTLAGALAGWMMRHVIRDSVIAPPLLVLAASILAEIVYVSMAPTHYLRSWPQTRHWLHVFGGELLYNVILSYPVYLAFRRIKMGEREEEPFA